MLGVVEERTGEILLGIGGVCFALLSGGGKTRRDMLVFLWPFVVPGKYSSFAKVMVPQVFTLHQRDFC